MIYNFRSKDAEAIWHGYVTGALASEVQQIARRKLRMLNSARVLEDLRTVVEPNGRHSLSVDEGARIFFTWKGRGAKDVDFGK